MSDQEVKVRITTDASGAVTGFKTVRDEMTKTDSHTTGICSKIKANWLGITAAVAGTAATLSQAWNMAETAAQFEQSQGAFKSMAESMGADAQKLYATLREKSAGLIDQKSLTEAANRAMSLGIPVEKLGDLMEIARAKARDMGTSTAQAFNDIATGVGRGSPLILDNLGLVMKVGDANDKMAKSLGKTAAELTETEKKTALLNATIEAGSEALSRYDLSVLTPAEKMQKLRATVADLELVMGQGLIRAFAGVYGVMQTTAAGALALSSGLFRVIQGYSWLREKTSFGAESKGWESLKNEYSQNAEAAWKAAGDLFGKAKDNFGAMIAPADQLAAAMKKVGDQTKQAVDEQDKQLKAIEAVRKESLRVATEDKKNLDEQLQNATNYYNSLREQIEKNVEDEKKGLEAIKALRQQRVDIDNSTASLISKIKGTNLSAKDQYETSRSALNQQYSDALGLSGQDRIRALEEYKQAVAALQSQFAQGVMGAADIFGKPDEIISAKTVAEDAISDIERAAQNQKNTLAQLTDEQQAQNDAVSEWGQVLKTEAAAAQSEMDRLKSLIADISAQIQAMEKTVTLTGVDNVTGVVSEIETNIQKLHELAAKPITLTIRTNYTSSGSSGYTSAGLNLDASLNLDALVLGQYAAGTPYVPRTGNYKLHQGEAVLDPEESKAYRSGKTGISVGNININIPESAARGGDASNIDWRSIVRNQIMPELRKLNA